MKFLVFGGADCPDLVLAQLAGLSALTDAEADAVVDFAVEALAKGAPPPGDAASDAEEARDALLASEALQGADPYAVAQAACALHTLARNTARYRVPLDTASHEFGLLGVPSGVVDAMARAIAANDAAIHTALADEVPKRPGAAVAEPGAKAWLRGEEQDPEVHVTLCPTRGLVSGAPVAGAAPLRLALTPEKARALLAELVNARETMRM